MPSLHPCSICHLCIATTSQVDLGRDPAAGGIGQALLFPGCANIQPLQYINALAQAIVGKYGVRIFENSRVTKMNGKHVRSQAFLL